jgi:hypothetical protein
VGKLHGSISVVKLIVTMLKGCLFLGGRRHGVGLRLWVFKCNEK